MIFEVDQVFRQSIPRDAYHNSLVALLCAHLLRCLRAVHVNHDEVHQYQLDRPPCLHLAAHDIQGGAPIICLHYRAVTEHRDGCLALDHAPKYFPGVIR